jgi:hypothetical protein
MGDISEETPNKRTRFSGGSRAAGDGRRGHVEAPEREIRVAQRLGVRGPIRSDIFA